MVTQPVKQPYFYFPIHPTMVTQPTKQPYFYFPIHPTMVTQPVKQSYFYFPGNYPFSLITGFPWKTFKTWNFVVFLSRNLTSKPRKKLEICKFYVSSFTFQDDLLLCHIYIINTNTDSKPNWPWISLLLPGKYMEFCVTREVGTLHLF